VSTKIPFVVGDIVKGCNTDRDYRIFDAGATHFKTRRLDDNIIKSVDVATAGTLIISAEETQRRFAAYEKWLEKQQKETI